MLVTREPTLAAALTGGNEGIFRNLLLIIAGSVFIALMAQLSIRLPFSPVPVTGQTFAVLVIGMAFGARLGAATVIAYLLEGLVFGVFAEARTWFHPATGWTAGYLMGFVAAAYITGTLAGRGWDRSITGTGCAMLMGNIAIYVPGMLWLGVMLGENGSINQVLSAGLLPFLAGDAVKITFAVIAFPAAWRLIRK